MEDHNMRDKLLSRHWLQYQPLLFGHPDLEMVITEPLQKLIIVLDTIAPQNIAALKLESVHGRPTIDRVAMMRVFIAKSVLNIPENKFMRERLLVDYTLRKICGFDSRRAVPCEGTFSNVLKEFSEQNLIQEIHEDMIKGYLGDLLVENISRDATAIPAREKSIKSQNSSVPKKPKKRGRPKKGDEPQTPPKRIELQRFMTLDEAIEDLPAYCDFGTKKNAKGVKETWRGYKLHLDVDDRGIPISYLLTSASLHDSQAAIPLEKMTADRVTSLYTLMDAGYVSYEISDFIKEIGKVPVVAPKKPKGGELIPLDPPKKERFMARTVVERANSDLKDNLAGSAFRFRTAQKIGTHLGVALIVLAAEQIARYIL